MAVSYGRSTDGRQDGVVTAVYELFLISLIGLHETRRQYGSHMTLSCMYPEQG
jgi:hypothetical protein